MTDVRPACDGLPIGFFIGGSHVIAIRSFCSVFAFVLAASVSHAATFSLEEDYDALKDSGSNFVVIGTICEEVARLEMAAEYKEPQYHVVTGIAYGNSKKTIGELDVIVFENKSQDVVKIAEVKCWKDLDGGLRKALDQRQRFLKNIQKGGIVLRSTHDKRQYSAKQFRDCKDFETIGQQGAKDYGYNRELDHSLEDLMGLRTRIMNCQTTGECKQP